MNSIQSIKLLGKRKTCENTRIMLKRLGPPRPEDITQTTVNLYTSKQELYKFDTKLYELTDWLCGCPKQSALFCYFCIVMNDDTQDADDLWGSEGVTEGIMSSTDLKKQITKHQQSRTHRINTLNYLALGENTITHRLSRDHFFDINRHNKAVYLNQHTLNVLIDCIKYNTGEFNLEHEIAKLKRLNPNFLEQLQTLEDDLLDAIRSVYVNTVREEIARTDFVSIELNEAANVGSPVAVFIVRYELQGQVHERFMGFKTLKSKLFPDLLSVIFRELSCLGILKAPDKLISYSHDLSIPSEVKNELHRRIKSVYQKVQFVHSYNHKFDVFFERTVWKFKEFKIFLGNVENVAAFFAHPKCIEALNAVVEKRLPRGYKITWNFDAQKLMTVFIHRDNICACISKIVATEADPCLVAKAQALQSLLESEDFNYWLSFFGKLMPACNDFANSLEQVEVFDVAAVNKTVETFKRNVEGLKKDKAKNSPQSEHEPLTIKKEVTVEESELNGAVIKQEVSNGCDITLDPLHSAELSDQLAVKICDLVLDHLDDNFTSTYLYLSIAALVKAECFARYVETFPNTELNLAVSTFSHLDAQTLGVELNVLYRRQEMKYAESVLLLLQYFYKHNLHGCFAETSKLLKIVCTMPMMTEEPGRCFQTLTKAKSFFEKVQIRNNYDTLTMCWLGKDLMQCTPNFNQLVINRFSSQRNRREDFTYQSVC